jgi:acylphosphatase
MTARFRNRVVYRGRVQGVGFRATVQSLASDFDVAGFVRNLPDGTVEVVAEGAASELAGFLDAIGSRMEEYIEGNRTEVVPAEGELGPFRVRH